MAEISAALRRVRGVRDVRLDLDRCEAVVVRVRGRASTGTLLANLEAVGYPGSVIPIRACTLRLRAPGGDGVPARVEEALRRVRGVRRVQVVGHARAVVTYDRRRVDRPALLRAVTRLGVSAEIAS